MPNGPNRNDPGLPVQQAAEDARRVEPRDAQPVDRAVGCDERARVAVGQEGVVRDRRERRRHRRALRRWLCRFRCPGSPAHPRLVPPAEALDELVGLRRSPRALRVRWTGGGESSSGCNTRHVSSTPSCRVNRVLSPASRPQQHLVRRRTFTPLQGELHVEVDGGGALLVGPVGLDGQPDPVVGSSRTTSWFSSGRRSRSPNPSFGDA